MVRVVGRLVDLVVEVVEYVEDDFVETGTLVRVNLIVELEVGVKVGIGVEVKETVGME